MKKSFFGESKIIFILSRFFKASSSKALENCLDQFLSGRDRVNWSFHSGKSHTCACVKIINRKIYYSKKYFRK